ncbi:MAG: glycerate kinase [Planctomycetota bacterium]
MKILIAPDKFKDALDAEAAADAMAAGVRAAGPAAAVDLCPLGDGGEGTGRILAAALGATEQTAPVLDPLGRRRVARWWSAPRARLAIIEMAEASGLMLLAAGERNALHTSSYGTGQLLAAARAAGCARVLLCVGGSATVDGGAGCLQALGWRFFDAAGGELRAPMSGGTLAEIARIEPAQAGSSELGRAGAERAGGLQVDVLCDVDNPLLGPRGAAPVFGPQKGATPEGVARLEAGLQHWANLLEAAHGRQVREVPGGGAAGGVPAGLFAALGARLRPGFDEVAQHVRLAERLAGCDLCLTGEGRIDDQTAGGKVVAGVAHLTKERGVPAVALVGAARLRPGQMLAEVIAALGLAGIVVITPPGTALPQALAATADNLRRAAEAVVSRRRA